VVRGSQAHEEPYRNFLHAITSIVRREGVLGLYRGLGPSLLLVSQGALHFAGYKILLSAFPPDRADSNRIVQTATQSMIASGASKVGAVVLTYPLQVVRTRMQARNADQTSYGSITRAMTHVAAREGLRGFYRGLGVCLIRTVGPGALTFAMYETTAEILSPRPRRTREA